MDLLDNQYFATAEPIRTKLASCSPKLDRSYKPAKRKIICEAASTSTSKSATTFAIKGWSTKVLPNAERFETCHPACATAWRIKATAQLVQSILVALTILIIVGMPLPSSPTIQPFALSYSISLEALDLFPSLSFRRMRDIEF